MSGARRILAISALAALLSCHTSNDITVSPSELLQEENESAGTVPPPLPSGRLPSNVTPLRYALALEVDPLKERFSGDVKITVQIQEATRAIVLHGESLSVVRAQAEVGGDYVPFEVRYRAPVGDLRDEIVLVAPRDIPAGKATLRIAFSAPIGTDLAGLYRVEEGGESYAFTQLEPIHARRLFPCFDEPSFKVPFDLRVTTPRENGVFANGREAERTLSEDGRSVTFTFATTPPLPTFLLGLAVGPLEVHAGPAGGVPIRVVAPKGNAKLGEVAIAAAQRQISFFESYFQQPFPYEKLDLVAVPELANAGMENAGLIMMRSEILLIDERASAQAKRSLEHLLAHELTHQWMGNLVTVSWWDDLWLSEGFATWMESRTGASGTQARALGLSGDRTSAMLLDGLDTTRPVRSSVRGRGDITALFDGVTYGKAASVLDMLESWVGEDAFRDGVRGFLAAHKNGVATSNDFVQALSVASGKEVWPIASAFIDRPGFPLVTAELRCKNQRPSMRLSQSHYRSRPSSPAEQKDALWQIPVCIVTDADKQKPTCALLDGAVAEVPLPGTKCPRWAFPNAGQRGYFRVLLTPDTRRAVLGEYSRLDPVTRMQLVDDAWALVESGDLGGDTLVEVLRAARQERDRAVIERLVAALHAMHGTLVDDRGRAAFSELAASILMPLARDVGFSGRPSDTEDRHLLRRSVLSAASVLVEDDPWLRGEADRITEAYLKDPASVDPNTAAIALRISSRPAGTERWQALLGALRSAKTSLGRIHALGALSSFADRSLLTRSLDLLLSEDAKRPDVDYLVRGATAWPKSREIVFDWLAEHESDLPAIVPAALAPQLVDVLGLACNAKARAYAFTVLDALRARAGDQSVEQARERVDRCLELRAREQGRVLEALK